MGRVYWLALVLVACLALGFVACGDDDNGGAGGQGTGAQAAGGSGGGLGGDGAGGSGGTEAVQLTVHVVDQANGDIEAAGVAVDFSDDTRRESLTDAVGTALIDLPPGVAIANIIAHKDGCSFTSLPGGLLDGELEVTLGLEHYESYLGVEVSGTAAGMNDPANDLLVVSSSTGLQFAQTGTSTYSVGVEPNQPFTLVGVDLGAPIVNGQDVTRPWHAAVVTTHGAITQPTTVDIDFGLATPSSATFNSSFALPPDPVLASTGVAMVDAWISPLVAMVGGSTACTVSGNTVDCTGEVWDGAGPVGATMYWVVESAAVTSSFITTVGRMAAALIDGGPSAGFVDLEFCNPPDVSTPTGAGPHPIDTPVQYTVASGGPECDFMMVNIMAPDTRSIGIAYPYDGQVAIPPLPSTSDSDAHYASPMYFFLLNGGGDVQGAWGRFSSESWEASPPAN